MRLFPNLLSHCGQGNSPSSGRLGVALPSLAGGCGLKGEVTAVFDLAPDHPARREHIGG